MNSGQLKVGILHPGEMGSFVADSVIASVGKAYWCSQGRSNDSKTRAVHLGLSETLSLNELCSTCDILISVCPPHAAEAQALAVIATGYKGLYLDANAISPLTAKNIASQMQAADINFVDGGIVGLPTYKTGTTWLYLSGAKADQLLPCFSKGYLEAKVLGIEIGQASALKMCFAAWNKGKSALLTSVLAAADELGVREALENQWDLLEPDFSEQSSTRICNIARKAWRFGPEMEEIAATLKSCNVPHESFLAAAELYKRESKFKDRKQAPALTEILDAVRQPIK